MKTTIWEKQNLREGFKETFKPLIESQDSVKKSIDKQQDATIEQHKKINLLLQKDFKGTDLQLHPDWKKLMKLMKECLIWLNYQDLKLLMLPSQKKHHQRKQKKITYDPSIGFDEADNKLPLPHDLPKEEGYNGLLDDVKILLDNAYKNLHKYGWT